jgi:TorA maturation chaperone TorD
VSGAGLRDPDLVAPGVESAALLRLLALGLAPPTGATVAEAAALADALADRPGMPAELAAFAAAATATTPDEVALAHERLFAADPVASPYEASITIDPFAQVRGQADVAGFYAAFGAAAHGAADHAGTELEFLSFLALRRLEAEDEGRVEEARRCAAVEESFLTEHAGRWLPPFFRRLAAGADDPWHASLGHLGAAAVERELALRSLRVTEVEAPRGPRLGVEADELECGGDEPATPFVDQVSRPHRTGRRRATGGSHRKA